MGGEGVRMATFTASVEQGRVVLTITAGDGGLPLDDVSIKLLSETGMPVPRWLSSLRAL